MKKITINMFRDELMLEKTKDDKMLISIGSRSCEISRPAARELIDALSDFLGNDDPENGNEKP